MSRAVPPDWPEGLPPVGADEFEQTAVAWLWDQAPYEWRADPALQRHPLLLSRFLLERCRADVAAARAAWAQSPEWRDVPGDALEAVRVLLEREGPTLALRARQVEMVTDALRTGKPWVPRL